MNFRKSVDGEQIDSFLSENRYFIFNAYPIKVDSYNLFFKNLPSLQSSLPLHFLLFKKSTFILFDKGNLIPFITPQPFLFVMKEFYFTKNTIYFSFNNAVFVSSRTFTYLHIWIIRYWSSLFSKQHNLKNLILKNNLKQSGFFSTFFLKKSNIFLNKQPLILSLKLFNHSNQLIKTSLNSKSLNDVGSSITLIWVTKINQLALTHVRHSFFTNLRKKLKYQHRVTSFILKFYRLKTMELIIFNQLTLLNLLMRLDFINNLSCAKSLINKNLIFLNKLKLKNTSIDLLLSVFDIVSFLIHFKVIVYLNWLLLLKYYRLNRFYFYFKKWKKKRSHTYPQTPSFRIPNWVLKFIIYNETPPHYLELDYLTLSFIIFYDPLIYLLLQYLPYKLNSVSTIRGLNWKSLT